MNELEQASLFNKQLDRLLGQGPDQARPGEVAGGAGDGGLLAVALALAALPELLPPPDSAFEQRVWQRVRAVEQEPGWSGWLRRRLSMGRPAGLRWAAALATLVLLITLALPGPRQALATWVAQFQLGGVRVAVVPEETVRPRLAAQSQHYTSLAEAEADVGFDLLEPDYLPAGYELAGVEAVSYRQLPVWLQPLYVEASYRPPDSSPDVTTYAVLREFNAAQAGNIRVGEIEFQTESVRSASDVVLPNGLPAVLIEFDAAAGDRTLLRQLIWEQDGLTLELWSQVLPLEEMLRIAASLRQN